MLWVCAGERCPVEEVLGPHFFLIIVFVGPLYTENPEILFYVRGWDSAGSAPTMLWHNVGFLAELLLI